MNVVRPTLEIKVLLADSADGNDVYNDGGGTECLVEEVLTIAFTGRRGQADEMTSHGVSMSHLPDGWILTLAERCADAVNALASYNLPGLYGDEYYRSPQKKIRVSQIMMNTTWHCLVMFGLIDVIEPKNLSENTKKKQIESR